MKPSTETDSSPPPKQSALSSGSKACPKCAFVNPDDADECLRCGIIFDRYEAFLEKRRRLLEEVSTTTDGLIDSEQFAAVIAQASEDQPSADVFTEFAKTRCPHCRQRYRIRTDQVGITTRCRKCSSIFKIEPISTDD